jgi:glycosyltransferase 2 family protein
MPLRRAVTHVLWAVVRRLVASPLVRLLISLGLLVWVLSTIDLGAASNRVEDGEWGWFACAVGILLTSLVVAAHRWHLYLRAAKVELSFERTLRAYFVGAFATNLLPSQVGGDVARAWIAGRPGTRLRAMVTVLVDRITAFACLVLLAWTAVALGGDPVPTTLVTALGASTSALAIVLIVVSALMCKWHPGWLFPSAPTWKVEIAATLKACLAPPAIAAKTLALGVLYQILVILALWLIAKAIHLPLTVELLVVTAPPVLLLATLPLSIAGLGVREGAYVVLLREAGYSAADAALFSLLITAAFALATLPGALLWVWARDPRLQ